MSILKHKCVEQWCGYITPVSINVVDPRLGVCRYASILAIVIYVILYNVVYKCQYIKAESPVGVVRFSLRIPARTADGAHGCSLLTDGDCVSALRKLDELPYCTQNPNADAITIENCSYEDELEGVRFSGSSVIIPTFVREYHQIRKCKPLATGETSCGRLWDPLPIPDIMPEGGSPNPPIKRSYFVADIERSTLLIDHAAVAPELGITAKSVDYFGPLKTESETLCTTHPRRTSVIPASAAEPLTPSTGAPCYIMPNQTSLTQGLDVFELTTLLQAANVSLDAQTHVSDEACSTRREGTVIVINIRYFNHRPIWGIWDTPRYQYDVFRIPRTVKETVSQLSKYPDERVVRDAHGIQLFVIQSGSLGAFSAIQLLLTVTTALTMLAVSNFVVDCVALYILPEKEHFQKLKYPTARLNRHGELSFKDSTSSDSGSEGGNDEEPAYEDIWTHEAARTIHGA